MRFNFRTKLLVLVSAIAMGFLVLITANILISNSVEKQLAKIHGYYIPMIKLGPHLESQFGRIMRGLQDAVSAHDTEALAATDALNSTFLDELRKAAEVIYPEDPARISSLLAAVSDIYATAHDVSLRLMRGETGIPIVNAMSDMKTKYTQTNDLLQKAIVFNESKLTEAFTSVSKAQETAERLQLLISALCLVCIVAISFWISRGVLRSLALLTEGLLRFSEGNFELPVEIISQDELGEVAHTANVMAKQIQTLMIALKATNKELESFSYSVAHDLRAPLRAALGFSHALIEDYAPILPPDAREMLNQVATASKKMGELIDGLLSLSRIARSELVSENVNLSTIARDVLVTLQQGDPTRKVTSVIEKDVIARGDPKLLQIVLANLLGNSWKFTNKTPEAKIEFGKTKDEGQDAFFVRDNGAGFDMRYSEKLFGTFQRLHAESEFEGTGIGLATVQRIIHRHNGKIWAKSKPNEGATFFFNLG